MSPLNFLQGLPYFFGGEVQDSCERLSVAVRFRQEETRKACHLLVSGTRIANRSINRGHWPTFTAVTNRLPPTQVM